MRQYERGDVEYSDFYSTWMKSLAKAKTKQELEALLYGKKKEVNAAAHRHLKAIERTSSMSGNSMARAHARNSVAAAGEYAIALGGAIEIHELFPEEAKQ